MMKKTVSHEQILIKRDGGLKPVVASALPCGGTAVFRVFIARIYGAYDGVFRLRADEDFGKHGGVSVPLEWITFENGHDVFEAEIKVSDFCDSNGGLFFYRYEFKTYYGERYCVSDGFSELSVNALPSERQLLVYDTDNEITYSPKGIIYHIFVDRFRRSGKCEIKKSSVLNEDWENGIPEYAKKNGDFLKNNTVFGGDLYGIVEKLDYIKSLGTELIYLSPIFDAYSNHKYDTGDYMRVDESFGGDEALDLLISEAKKRGIGIILDGVFNHTGDDSVYFNRYGNYPDTGAYQSEKSPYYNWYTFRHFPDDYECWWNIKILPRVRCDEPSYREFICGDGGVLEKWMRKGVRGFRLDVADELSDGFIASIRKKIKKETSDGVLYGEVWENASNKVAYSTRREYFRGKELDSVMNYPLRKAVIEYLRNGNAAQFKTLLYDVYGTYPPFAARLLMNFLGTHDTERIITALAAPPWDGKSNDELAVLKMNENERARGEKLVKLALALVFTVPGVPCVFYGDEVGVEGYHDPFNRRTFPWGHENCSLADFLRTLSVIRAENSVFKDGDFRICEATAEYLILERKNADGGILTVVNRSDKTLTLAFENPVLNLLNGDEVSVITVSGLTCSMLRFDGETPDYEIE